MQTIFGDGSPLDSSCLQHLLSVQLYLSTKGQNVCRAHMCCLHAVYENPLKSQEALNRPSQGCPQCLYQAKDKVWRVDTMENRVSTKKAIRPSGSDQLLGCVMLYLVS